MIKIYLVLLWRVRTLLTMALGFVTLSVPVPVGATTLDGASCDTASPIVFGAVHKGYHDHEGDLDYFSFDVPARGVVRIRAQSTSFEEPRIQVLGGHCLGLAPTDFRDLGGTDVDRILYFDQPGRQVARLRTGNSKVWATFSVQVDFVPTPQAPTDYLDALGDAPDTCEVPGGLAKTTTPPPDEDDMGGQGISWPNPEPNRVAVGTEAYLRIEGDLVDYADEDVVSVKVTQAGLLDVAATGIDIAVSLYEGDQCTRATQIATDVAVGEVSLLQWVEPGVYHLRLSPRNEWGGDYQLALRMLPLPGSR